MDSVTGFHDPDGVSNERQNSNTEPLTSGAAASVGVRCREAAAAVLAQDIRLREVKLENAVEAHRRRVTADDEQARREESRIRDADMRVADAASALDRRGHELELQTAQLRDRVAAAREQQLSLDGRERELRWREDQIRTALAEVTAARQRILAREAKFVDDAEMRAHLAAVAAATAAATAAAAKAASAATATKMPPGQSGSPLSNAVTPRWDRSEGAAGDSAVPASVGNTLVGPTGPISLLSTSSFGGGSAPPLGAAAAAAAAAYLPFMVALGSGGGGFVDARRATAAPTALISPPPPSENTWEALGAAVMSSFQATASTTQAAGDAARRERDATIAAREARIRFAEEELKLKTLAAEDEVAAALADRAQMSIELAAANEALATARALIDAQETQAALKDDDYRRVYQELRAELRIATAAAAAAAAGAVDAASHQKAKEEEGQDADADATGSAALELAARSTGPREAARDALLADESACALLQASRRDRKALAAAVAYFVAATDAVARHCESIEVGVNGGGGGTGDDAGTRSMRSWLKKLSIADRAAAIGTTALARAALLALPAPDHDSPPPSLQQHRDVEQNRAEAEGCSFVAVGAGISTITTHASPGRMSIRGLLKLQQQQHQKETTGGRQRRRESRGDSADDNSDEGADGLVGSDHEVTSASRSPAKSHAVGADDTTALVELLTTVKEDLRDIRNFIDMRRDALALEPPTAAAARENDDEPIKASHYSGRSCTVVAALALQLVERARALHAAVADAEASWTTERRRSCGVRGTHHPKQHQQQSPTRQPEHSPSAVVGRYLDDVIAAAATGGPPPAAMAFRADGRVAVVGASTAARAASGVGTTGATSARSPQLGRGNVAGGKRRAPMYQLHGGAVGAGASDGERGMDRRSPQRQAHVSAVTPPTMADPSFVYALSQLPPEMRAGYTSSM